MLTTRKRKKRCLTLESSCLFTQVRDLNLIAIVSINLIRNIGREAIINALKENSTVIVMGETGSGKTTRK